MASTATHSYKRAEESEAQEILSSIENLMIEARRRNETIPQTRLYYQKQLAGFEPRARPSAYTNAGWSDDIPAWITERPDPKTDPRVRARAAKEAELKKRERRQREFEARMEVDEAGEELDGDGDLERRREIEVKVERMSQSDQRDGEDVAGEVREGGREIKDEDVDMGMEVDADADADEEEGGVRLSSDLESAGRRKRV